MIKKKINDFLSVFGIGIFRLRKSEYESNGNIPKKAKSSDFEIKSPVDHNTPERMNDFFSDNRMLEQYLGEERIEFYREIVKITKEFNIDLQNKDVIDVGTGTGHLLSFFSEHYDFKSITGIDFSESAIEVSKKTLPEGNFFIHDLYLKLDKKYDMILCTEVIEHLLNPDQALRNMIDMMSNDSVCLITVPNGRIDQYEGHINFWSPESWEVFIKNSCKGLSVKTGTLLDKKNNYALISNRDLNKSGNKDF